VKCVRKSGTVLLFGVPHKGARYDLDLAEMFLNEIQFRSSYATTESELQQAIDILETGKIRVENLVTGKYSLDQIEEAMAAARSEMQLKVVVVP